MLRKETKSFLHDFDTQCQVDAFLAKRNDLTMEEEECLAGYFISVLMGGDETALPDVLQVTIEVARKAQPHSSVVVGEEALRLPTRSLQQLLMMQIR